MDIKCTVCTDGVSSAGTPCTVCGGDGKINLTGENLSKYGDKFGLHGIVWDDIITKIASIVAEQASQRVALTSAFADVNDKLNDIMDKCNDIKEKLDES